MMQSAQDVTGPRTNVERVALGVAYLYLLRVPLITWFALVILPIVSVPDNAPAEALLRGLFDIVDQQESFVFKIVAFALVAVSSLMVAAAIAITSRIILCDGEERFGGRSVPLTPGLELLIRVLSALVPLLILTGACWQTHRTVAIGWMAAGIALGGAVFFFVMKPAHDWLWNRVFPPENEAPANEAPPPRVPRMSSIARVVMPLLAAAAWVVRFSPAGFIDPRTHRLRDRHVFAVFQLWFSLALYVLIWYAKGYVGFGALPTVPTLCLILLLAMLLCWSLAPLTFFFDRFRIPLLMLLVGYGTIVSVFPQGDNFYRPLRRAASVAPPSASGAEILKRRAHKPAIVVATTGGGIQAAAWTARVLSGLKQDLEATGSEFDESILVLSAVSGGSAGAMYVVDAYTGGQLPPVGAGPAALNQYAPVVAAETSSLDEVAWGLVYPDLVWSVAPFLKGVSLWPPSFVHGPNLTTDRGSILENAWKRTEGLKTASLDDWRRGAVRGERPAVIFNATIVESGERMLMATTRFEAGAGSTGRREFVHQYEDSDVLVATAARLSATFPYVTPAARILRDSVTVREPHLVDGGYYDNYGTATLIEWLNQALRQPGLKPSAVLLLQIRSSSTRTTRPEGSPGGWIFQALHPLTTMMNVRGTGQLSHSEVDVQLIETERYPSQRGTVPVKSAVFEFNARRPDGDPVTAPLSWHLTPEDRKRLSDEWSNSMGSKRECVREFLKGNVAKCVD